MSILPYAYDTPVSATERVRDMTRPGLRLPLGFGRTGPGDCGIRPGWHRFPGARIFAIPGAHHRKASISPTLAARSCTVNALRRIDKLTAKTECGQSLRYPHEIMD